MVGVSVDCVVVDSIAIIDGWGLSLVCGVVGLFSNIPIALGVLFLHRIEGRALATCTAWAVGGAGP